MLRSMYSGVSGLRNFQIKLDVIGNNIANVNTHGFKKGRVTFQDLFSQSAGGASAPDDGVRGGTNPRQVGLGASLGSIDTVHTGGSTQTTLRELDLAIEGDGFFAVKKDGNEETVYYTRNGVFYLDAEGQFVNSNGYLVLDTNGDPIKLNGTDTPDKIKSLSIGTDGKISYLNDSGLQTIDPGIGIARFANNDGLEKAGQNLYITTPNATADGTDPDLVTPGEDGSGIIRSGTLEMSNVDLSEEFVEMIVAQRGLQANTRIITTSDEVLQELLNIKR